MAATRAPTVTEEPAGFLYVANFLDEAEEQGLVTACDAMAFSEIRMRGQAAKRTVAHFGLRYDYESWGLVPVDPWPASLSWVRERAATLAGVEPAELEEALVTRYPTGAGIGWHRDAPRFGPKVVGISLLSPCRMRFQRRVAAHRHVYERELAPRSAYVLGGAARWSWQHSIPATAALRYSVTFRTLSRRGRTEVAGPPP